MVVTLQMAKAMPSATPRAMVAIAAISEVSATVLAAAGPKVKTLQVDEVAQMVLAPTASTVMMKVTAAVVIAVVVLPSASVVTDEVATSTLRMRPT